MIHYSTIASPNFRSTPGYETLIRVVGEETLTYASSHAISQQLEAYIHLMISMDPEYKVCCTANIAGNARDSESNVETIFPHTWYEHLTHFFGAVYTILLMNSVHDLHTQGLGF
jgi:hypothetical protein